jgi:cell division protein FtsB
MRRTAWLVLVSVAGVAMLFVLVFPARDYLAGRRQLKATTSEIAVFRSENAKLSAKIKLLQTDGEIEQLARQDYGLVMPGEQAYAILPAKRAGHPASGHGSSGQGSHTARRADVGTTPAG